MNRAKQYFFRAKAIIIFFGQKTAAKNENGHIFFYLLNKKHNSFRPVR